MKTEKKKFSFLAAAFFIFSTIIVAPGNVSAVEFLSFGTGALPGPIIFSEQDFLQ